MIEMEEEEEEEEGEEEQSSMEDDDGEEEEGGEEEGGGNPNQGEEEVHAHQELEALAKEWLAKLIEEGRAVTMTEIEDWISSNKSSLPEHLLTLTHSQILARLTAFHTSLLHHKQEANQSSRRENPARFQRTNLWLPVYSWLESLDADDVIKSKEITDWLAENSDIRDTLSAKHSRYHLMHYIKKCHVKILKKRGKFKGDQFSLTTSSQIQAVEVPRLLAPTSYNSLSHQLKDSELHIAKRNEALRKYEILVELEKQLAKAVPKQ